MAFHNCLKLLRIRYKILCYKKFSDISYIHNVGKEPLRPLTLGKLMEEIAHDHGETTAVISCHQKKKINFGEALYQADRLAAGMLKMGFRQGDMIGLWAPNIIEWYIAFLACARAGFISVGLNPLYQQKEIEYCINKVGIKGIVCGSVFKKQDFYKILKSVCPELSESVPGNLQSNNLPSLRTVIMISPDKMRGTQRFTDVLNMADDEGIGIVQKNQKNIKTDDPLNIQFTSGTTGFSKAAVVSHFSVVNNSFYIGRRNEFHKKRYTICVPNPLFHAYGTVVSIVSGLMYTGTLVLPSDGYDPEKTLSALTEEKCTIVYGTPTMFVDLIELQKARKEKLHIEIALCGGASCSPQLFKYMLDVLKVRKVKSIYGLSEATAGAFQSLEDDDEYKSISTVGYLHDHLEAKVIDANGNIVPIGVSGELCLRGYSMFLEYYNDEEKTKEAKSLDGWLRTGDQFIFDENKYGTVVGRLKEMIIRGGENIYPKEIEDYLNTHPDIIESHVVGLPHKRLGEEVCACLRTKNGRHFTVEEIKAYCQGTIANFKIPSVLKILDSFPKTTSGKIQKNKLLRLLLNEENIP
nr:acyl-CoA synthetase family member 2, mitochondrial-like [Leptinotarsa decemlineata]